MRIVKNVTYGKYTEKEEKIMAQSTIAIIILVGVLVLYAVPSIPLSVTTIFAMLAMAMSGVLTYTEAFTGFANSAVLLVAGMMVIGRACFTSGLAQRFGNLLFRFVGAKEKKFMIMVILIASAMAVFLNGSLVVAMMMPIIDSVASQSGGKISRKQIYFPLGLASTIGNNLTTISATSMITAAGLISAAGYGELSLFAPTVVNLPALLIVIVLYIFFGYDLQKKWFNFDEIPIDAAANGTDGITGSTMKMWITGGVLVAVVIALIAGVNSGTVALAGSAVLILTRCIDERDAYKSISWPSVIIVAGAIGFSAGLDKSGAGLVIAEFILKLFGAAGQSPFGICIVLFILGSLLSNVMSDNATVAVLIPITLSLAATLGCDPIPMVLACASGIKVAVATPVSVAPMTMIQVPGYRFKDYLRVGGLVNLISLIVTCAVIWIAYYM